MCGVSRTQVECIGLRVQWEQNISLISAYGKILRYAISFFGNKLGRWFIHFQDKKRSRRLIHLIQGQDPIITETVPLVEAVVCVCHCVWTLTHPLFQFSQQPDEVGNNISPCSSWEKATFGGCKHVFFFKLYLLNGRIPIQMPVFTTLLLQASPCHLLFPSPRGEQGTEPRALSYWLLGQRGPFFPTVSLFPVKSVGAPPHLSWHHHGGQLWAVSLVISCFSAMFSLLQ